jgi:hypothetical protein
MGISAEGIMTFFKKLSALGLFMALSALPFSAFSSPHSPYIVVPGDCLWSIAARMDVFHNAWHWPLLLGPNRGLIDNPELIRPGWKLEVPLHASVVEKAVAKLYAMNYGEEGVPLTELPFTDRGLGTAFVPKAEEAPLSDPWPIPKEVFYWLAAVMAAIIVSLRVIVYLTPEAPKSFTLYKSTPTESEAILRAEAEDEELKHAA